MNPQLMPQVGGEPHAPPDNPSDDYHKAPPMNTPMILPMTVMRIFLMNPSMNALSELIKSSRDYTADPRWSSGRFIRAFIEGLTLDEP